MKKLCLFILLTFLVSCGIKQMQKQEKSRIDNVQNEIVSADTLPYDDWYWDRKTSEQEEIKQNRETRLRFPNFNLIIHDFQAYTEWEKELYWEQDSLDYPFTKGVYFNKDERDNENYVETLIVTKDTLFLSESWGEEYEDNRINNTLFQILPNNPQDRFEMFYCYLSRLGEGIDDRNYSREELKNFRYEDLIQIKEQTPYYQIKDSARYFFRALPHSPDMEVVTIENGEMVFPNQNTQEQMDWEQKQYEKEWNRIKKKYHLKDTLVEVPGEYTSVFTLTKDNKLFGYGYDSFLFRIDRYQKKKLVERKYIVIAILYGC
ncbi:MAG: hypothetical protein LBN27_07705 [Prevotellaceae bacterium]|jgi:hypothetical protein|nr:hypothetical protein [Prevotellaceae bacterium]